MVEAKSDGDDTVPTTDTKIIKQIEYYFGDINLGRDKFLKEQMTLDDGWVPLDTMLKFKRLAAISTDLSVIISALKKSESGLIQVNEEEKKIRRNPDLPIPEMNEEKRKELMTRTLYLKGFPTDSLKTDLLDLFNKFDGFEHLTMRSYLDKATGKWIFKGSVFANFKTIDAADKVLKLPELKYGETELKRLWQQQYLNEKREERLDEKKKRKKKDAPEVNPDEVKDENDKEDELPKGALVQLTGFPDGSQIRREEIKAKIENLGVSVAFLNFNIGEAVAWVRLDEEGSAAELIKKLDKEHNGKLKVEEVELSIRQVEGDEEDKFLTKAKQDMIKRKSENKNKHNKKGKFRNSAGGRGRKRRSDRNNGPPTKVVKL